MDLSVEISSQGPLCTQSLLPHCLPKLRPCPNPPPSLGYRIKRILMRIKRIL